MHYSIECIWNFDVSMMWRFAAKFTCTFLRRCQRWNTERFLSTYAQCSAPSSNGAFTKASILFIVKIRCNSTHQNEQSFTGTDGLKWRRVGEYQENTSVKYDIIRFFSKFLLVSCSHFPMFVAFFTACMCGRKYTWGYPTPFYIRRS